MPEPVRRAVWLMLAGASLQALSTLTTLLDRDHIRSRTAELAKEFHRGALRGDDLERATDQAYWFSVGTGVIFTVLWLVVARMCASGRHTGRVLATFLAIVYTFTVVFSGVRSFGPGALVGFMTAAIGISVVYLLWRRPVTPWMTARADDGGSQPRGPEASH